MITPIGTPNENNLGRTIDDINNGLPSKKRCLTPLHMTVHEKVFDVIVPRTKSSFGIVVGNYISRYMREFVSRHGGRLYAKVYYRDFKR